MRFGRYRWASRCPHRFGFIEESEAIESDAFDNFNDCKCAVDHALVALLKTEHRKLNPGHRVRPRVPDRGGLNAKI